MRGERRSSRGARIVGLLLPLAIGGCLATSDPVLPPPSRILATNTPSSSAPPADPAPSGEPAATATIVAPTSVATPPPIEAGACALKRLPDQSDAAPINGDLTDWSHTFGGRVRLCFAGDHPNEVEGTAFCMWTDPFTAVREVDQLPVAVGAETGQIDGGITLDRRVAYLSRTSGSGAVTGWEGDVPPRDLRAFDHGRRGVARFDVAPLVDPEHPPIVVPPNEVGLIRWACLEPAPA